MNYSYYPGCTLKTKAKELDRYARASAAALGVTLTEIDNWQCCGAVYPLGKDEIAPRLSPVRALDGARRRGEALVTVCSACHHVFKRVNDDMQGQPEVRDKVNRYLELETPYGGETGVVHYLEMLRDSVGFDALRAKVKAPLEGKRVAAYYGCLLLRPGAVMAFDDPENPSLMEDFVRAIGAEPVIYPYRNECCGGYVALETRELVQDLCNRILLSAAEHGAEAVITACPLCRYNLEQNGTASTLPVYYFTELLAQALDVAQAPDARDEGRN